MIKYIGYMLAIMLAISGGIMLYQDIVPMWAGVLMIVIGIIMTGLWRQWLSSNDAELKKDLIKIVVDKLLIALILILLSLIVDRQIDRYRSKLSFRKELNVTRAEKIGFVWESINLAQALTDSDMDKIIDEVRKQDVFRDKLKKGQISNEQWETEFAASGNKINELYASRSEQFTSISLVIEGNIFWLGEKHYSLAKNFLSTFLVVVPIGDKAYEYYKNEVEKKRSQSRIYLSHVIDDILMDDVSEESSKMLNQDLSVPLGRLRKIPPKDSNGIN